MELPDAFDEFFEEISLGATPRHRIESAATGLINYLTQKYGLGPGEVFLQGSVPNDTAVEPADSDGEYDADLVAVCAASGASPDDALDDLETVLAQDGTYRDLLRKEGSRKGPCVRLRYADDDVGGFHVDIVPARASSSADPQASLEVPRRNEGWHDSTPSEYTQWCRDQGPRFARTVMMLKRWRDVHQTARSSVSSIVLQVLAAQAVGSQRSDAEALVTTFEGMQSILGASPESPPTVRNPVLTAENLAARWKVAAYRDFRKELGEAVILSRQALDSPDEAESHRLWNKLLGDDFPARPGRGGGSGPPSPPAPGWERRPQVAPRRERYGR
jgi:hypothetical protein